MAQDGVVASAQYGPRINAEITDRASRLLDATGYGRATVTCRDAEHGVADYAPYDRIVLTAGTWDIPAAWTRQLAPGGRLVAPLRMRELTRSVALERNTGHWNSL